MDDKLSGKNNNTSKQPATQEVSPPTTEPLGTTASSAMPPKPLGGSNLQATKMPDTQAKIKPEPARPAVDVSTGLDMNSGDKSKESSDTSGVGSGNSNADFSSANIQDQPNSPPPPMGGSGSVVSSHSKKKAPFLSIIIGILIVLILATFAYVGYLYISNQGLKSSKQDQIAQATPTPTLVPDKYEVVNGSIYKTSGTGEQTMLIRKDDFEGVGLTGFFEVNPSPDKSKLCFYSLPPAIAPALYYSDVAGQAVVEVSEKKKECLWSNKSDKIAYIDDAKEGDPVDIYEYTIKSASESNLTRNAATASTGLRRYEIGQWSNDDSTLTCFYKETDTKTGNAIDGNCEIDLSSGKLTDLSNLNSQEEPLQ